MKLKRYAKVTKSFFNREIVLLKSFPCIWGKCTFCDYILDNSCDEAYINTFNSDVLRNVKGIYRALQVINSGSCFELPKETLGEIKKIVKVFNINYLMFEAYWSYRQRLSKMRDYFSAKTFFSLGIETFDNNFRNKILNKNIEISSVKEVADYFDSVCIMVGVTGQTKDMIKRDVDIILENFDYSAINLFTPNSTNIKPDKKLQEWFLEEYSWLNKLKKVELLTKNTDLGVG